MLNRKEDEQKQRHEIEQNKKLDPEREVKRIEGVRQQGARIRGR